jgi:hypothetical protein
MTEDKEQLLRDLKSKVESRLDRKFRLGDEEHKESIMTINSLDEAFDELIDGLTYIYIAMKQKEKDMEKIQAETFKKVVLLDKEEAD